MNQMIMNHNRYQKGAIRRTTPGQSGFSLLEVLIAVVILSVGLLGLAGMQVTSLQYVTSSLQRTQATSLAYDILDRIRANPNGVYTTGLGDAASGYSGDCLTKDCSATEMSTFDLSEWKTSIEDLLPRGQGAVEPGAGTEVTVSLRWTGKAVKASSGPPKILNITMSSEL